MQHNIFTTIRSLKLVDGCKGTQVYAFNPSTTVAGGVAAGVGGPVADKLPLHHRVNSLCSKSNQNAAIAEALLSYGLPVADLIEPPIDPFLKSVNLVETLAEVYRRLENCPQFDKSAMYLEQCSLFRSLCDPKLIRRSLRSARQYAVDVHSKVVLSAWLRFERREDELDGSSSMDCAGRIIECPKAAMVSGYDPDSVYDSYLRPVIPINACTLRITAAAGT